jgi:sulfur carrier protein
MKIKLNNQFKSFQEHCSIQQLLDNVVGDKQKGIAVAVNQHVIPKDQWPFFSINHNDEVLIIKATQGG